MILIFNDNEEDMLHYIMSYVSAGAKNHISLTHAVSGDSCLPRLLNSLTISGLRFVNVLSVRYLIPFSKLCTYKKTGL